LTNKKEKTKNIKFNFNGETLTPYQLIQCVNEEGIIELYPGIYLQTKEQLTFTNEEEIKEVENVLFYEPDNEDYQSEYEDNISKNYTNANYWITDENNNVLKKIKNYKMLKAFIINYLGKNNLANKE
jgi:hypothetical protein